MVHPLITSWLTAAVAVSLSACVTFESHVAPDGRSYLVEDHQWSLYKTVRARYLPPNAEQHTLCSALPQALKQAQASPDPPFEVSKREGSRIRTAVDLLSAEGKAACEAPRSRPVSEPELPSEPEAPEVAEGDGAPEGICRRADITAVIQAEEPAIRRCYEDALARNRALEGRIKLGWRIGQEGQVAWVRVVESSMNEPVMETCITHLVELWVFPRPRKGVCDIRHPFNFSIAPGVNERSPNAELDGPTNQGNDTGP